VLYPLLAACLLLALAAYWRFIAPVSGPIDGPVATTVSSADNIADNIADNSANDGANIQDRGGEQRGQHC
jgi:hypothetical protein